MRTRAPDENESRAHCRMGKLLESGKDTFHRGKMSSSSTVVPAVLYMLYSNLGFGGGEFPEALIC